MSIYWPRLASKTKYNDCNGKATTAVTYNKNVRDANSSKDARNSIDVQGSPKKVYYEIKKNTFKTDY
jgi:hypothetical protein